MSNDTCYSCGAKLPDDANYCPVCGKKIQVIDTDNSWKCSYCGNFNDNRDTHCNFCGTSIHNLNWICPSCGMFNSPSDIICRKCGNEHSNFQSNINSIRSTQHYIKPETNSHTNNIEQHKPEENKPASCWFIIVFWLLGVGAAIRRQLTSSAVATGIAVNCLGLFFSMIIYFIFRRKMGTLAVTVLSILLGFISIGVVFLGLLQLGK